MGRGWRQARPHPVHHHHPRLQVVVVLRAERWSKTSLGKGVKAWHAAGQGGGHAERGGERVVTVVGGTVPESLCKGV